MNVKRMSVELEIARLSGASNFRDFGGHPVAGDRRIKRRQLFRSNKLSALAQSDHECLTRLGIRAIFDLRLDEERDRDPTSWTHPDCRTYTFPPRRKRRLVDMALDYPTTTSGALALMHDFYAKMPHTMTHMFAAIFEQIADGGTPCIIHCSAGKDRTGVACALLLAALGVDRKTIVADYVLTKHARDREEDMARATVQTGTLADLRNRYPPEAVAVISDAAPSYIEAALGSAESRYGSLDAYFLQGLGLDETVLRDVRTRLLEPA